MVFATSLLTLLLINSRHGRKSRSCFQQPVLGRRRRGQRHPLHFFGDDGHLCDQNHPCCNTWSSPACPRRRPLGRGIPFAIPLSGGDAPGLQSGGARTRRRSTLPTSPAFLLLPRSVARGQRRRRQDRCLYCSQQDRCLHCWQKQDRCICCSQHDRCLHCWQKQDRCLYRSQKQERCLYSSQQDRCLYRSQKRDRCLHCGQKQDRSLYRSQKRDRCLHCLQKQDRCLYRSQKQERCLCSSQQDRCLYRTQKQDRRCHC